MLGASQGRLADTANGTCLGLDRSGWDDYQVDDKVVLKNLRYVIPQPEDMNLFQREPLIPLPL